ncbi:helix-hairpin-helix domain-containing protein [Streptomyces antarcticus]|uniref:helix-hairpin-helix domain-containing protein n=1 Tax=Streptomyces antarcticus TaxID=2996458 RepID=UPI00226DD4E9|nr:helix-hairpin-helix domain-containing protein [Streptomyces sp. H34-AA3]MCY0944386.1 helix-hairpin-helix domain-containing protein [Streptomyces sp. H34-AA3]
MTLRTRTRTPLQSRATSGPGRSRSSDGRLRFRGDRPRRAPAEPGAVRRRAEALLGGSSPPEGSSGGLPGASPPGELAGAPPIAGDLPVAPLRVRAEALSVEPSGAPSAASAGSSAGPSSGSLAGPSSGSLPGEAVGLSAGEARRLAVRERLPVWFQARCGVEPRTVGAVAIVLVVAVGFAGQQYWSARPQPVTAPAVIAPAPAPVPVSALAPVAASPGGPAPPGGARIVVDVGGKVREPGVRRLPAGSRVEDALAAAGGVRPGTDTTGLNRARVLVDGEQVLVGVPAQPQPQPQPPALALPGGGGGGGPTAGPLSLGSATVEQLDGLPGVGPVLARHIVDFRTARGGFRSVEELRQVNGIGERRFADLRRLVRP